MPRKNNLKVTPSTGNVFRDLGFSADEAEHLLVRAELLIQLQKALASRGLTQAKAAKILRVTQPRVSDMLRGRIDLFSTDSLIDMLARLGVHVRLVLKPARRVLVPPGDTQEEQDVERDSRDQLAGRAILEPAADER